MVGCHSILQVWLQQFVTEMQCDHRLICLRCSVPPAPLSCLTIGANRGGQMEISNSAVMPLLCWLRRYLTWQNRSLSLQHQP